MRINNETINFLADTIDDIVTHYYNYQNNLNLENVSETSKNKIHVTYLEALRDVIDLYMDNNEIEVDDKNQQIVDELVEQIDEWFANHTVNSEEIRRALLLLNIKGFKHSNYSLDLITPDAVGMILVHLVNAYFNPTDKINILDPNCGTGNLMALLNNYLPNEVEFVGIDNHQILTTLCSTEANFLEMSSQIYYQDALQDCFNNHDILVTDVASYDYDLRNYKSVLGEKGIKYFPYLLIEKYLSTQTPISKQIYLIDGDFFEQEGSEEFKNYLQDKAIIKSLIALPKSMFLREDYTRGILILETKDEVNKNQKTGVYILPSLSETEKLNKVLNEIKKDLKN